MRGRPHASILAAASAIAALAGVEALGAQRMVLPALNIPSLSAGGSRAKPGKHRLSGSVPSRGITMGYSRATGRTNASKRARRAQIDAYIAEHRNEPLSGWKRAVRAGRL